MEIFLILVIVIGAIYLYYNNKNNKNKINELENWQQNVIAEITQTEEVESEIITDNSCFVPYTKKFLLTKNEYYFYKKLKPIADELNLSVIAKVRLADIVEPQKTLSKSDWYKYFAKIKAKHIDFALCNPDNLQILLVIELNDNSHNSESRMNRDEFLEKIFNKINLPMLQTYGGNELKEQILKYLQK